jgi:hypothetical protein
MRLDPALTLKLLEAFGQFPDEDSGLDHVAEKAGVPWDENTADHFEAMEKAYLIRRVDGMPGIDLHRDEQGNYHIGVGVTLKRTAYGRARVAAGIQN